MTSLVLKIVLVVSMTIDHIAVVYLPYGSNWYTWLRMFGRPAMPIACFLLVQGFLKTSSRRKYTVRMLITAVIAEIFWIFLWLRQTMSADAAVKAAYEAAGGEATWGTADPTEWWKTLDAATKDGLIGGIVPMLNVLFTFVICLLMLSVLDKLQKRFGEMLPNQLLKNLGYMFSMVAVIIVTVLVCLILPMDYPLVAPVATTACYIFREERKTLMVALAIAGILAGTGGAVYILAWMIALPLIYSYNGSLGYDKDAKPWVRVLFNAYYPVHLAILVETKYFHEIFDSFSLFGK